MNLNDDWYNDVIHGKALTEPARIIIGTESENLLIITRQDWKGPKNEHGPWRSPEAFGYWDISFAREGLYNVKLIFGEPFDLRGVINIRAGTIQIRLGINDTTATEFILEGVPFKKGDFMFEAWCSSGGKIYSAMYVELINL